MPFSITRNQNLNSSRKIECCNIQCIDATEAQSYKKLISFIPKNHAFKIPSTIEINRLNVTAHLKCQKLEETALKSIAKYLHAKKELHDRHKFPVDYRSMQ